MGLVAGIDHDVPLFAKSWEHPLPNVGAPLNVFVFLLAEEKNENIIGKYTEK